MFFHTPSFPRLTYQQRELLLKLVRVTKEEGSHLGEFWWRADPDEPGIITQIKPRTRDGNFDPQNPMFRGKEWSSVAEQAQMLALERLGYVVVSDVEEHGTAREKWRHFAVTQLGFDFANHVRRWLPGRFAQLIWEKTENHLLAFVFGLLGALVFEILRIVLGGSLSGN